MEVLDRDFLLSNVDGDQELLKEIVGLFVESSGEILQSIRDAVTSANYDALDRSAHQLKGALANLGAQAAAAAATELENLGRRGMLTGLEDAMGALDREMERLAPELLDLVSN
ncbi:MAG: hypothetical protein DHS20C21_14110 [Gemmatimonadota bacterium]|nr:MAG: hypothetical protein DHS20C21_14110 [Gemmatimonadota bacterium]